MKKIVVALFVLIILAVIGIYAFMPGKIYFREVILVKVKLVNAHRYIIDESKWYKWWPKDFTNNGSDTSISNTNSSYKNYHYSVSWELLEGDSIAIKNNSIKINSLLNIIPINKDSVAIEWQGQSGVVANPVKRVGIYFEEGKVKTQVEEILQRMKDFLENKDNVYGIRIDQVMVHDTLLVASKRSSNTYPTTLEIYDLINKVKKYISNEGALETNFPMLHIEQDGDSFTTMVAIPVNKSLPPNNIFLIKRMVPGKILITEVKGGTYLTKRALGQIELYMNDYNLLSPAIPFQSLITDRSKEPDTLKWVTKIYYPVM